MKVKLAAVVSAASSAAAAALVAVAAMSPAGAGNAGVSSDADSMYTDKITDYGVCRGVDPSCYNDWGNGYTSGETKRILIYSRTAGPRHAHLGTPLAPGLNPPLGEDNVAQRGLKEWAEEQGIAVDWTEDVTRVSGLSKYQAVVFLSSNRDTLDDTAQTNLRQYIRAGGGFVGIHNAFGAEYNWPWYEGLLGGTNFYDHRPNRPGTVETLNTKDVSTQDVPRKWAFTDEWYNLEPFPTYVRPLAKVDAKTSSTPERASGHPGHGDNHLVSWCQYYDGGRAWLTTLGHDVKAWTDEPMAGDTYFKDHVVHGLLSAMGIEPFCTADDDALPPKDTTKPSTTLVAPTTSGPFGALNLQVDATDEVGLQRVVGNVYQNGKLVTSTQTAGNGATAVSHKATVALPEGTYQVRYNSQDTSGNISTTREHTVVIDTTAPTATVKTGASETTGANGTYAKVSFKLFDAGKVDKVTLNGVEKDLSNNTWSDVNFVEPGVFGAVRGENTLVVYDVAGNAQTTTFTLT